MTAGSLDTTTSFRPEAMKVSGFSRSICFQNRSWIS